MSEDELALVSSMQEIPFTLSFIFSFPILSETIPLVQLSVSFLRKDSVLFPDSIRLFVFALSCVSVLWKIMPFHMNNSVFSNRGWSFCGHGWQLWWPRILLATFGFAVLLWRRRKFLAVKRKKKLLQTTRCAGEPFFLPFNSCNSCDKEYEIAIEALARNNLSQSHFQRSVKGCQKNCYRILLRPSEQFWTPQLHSNPFLFSPDALSSSPKLFI